MSNLRSREPTASLWYGPMTSGKTNRIIDRMYVMDDAGYNCLLIKYKKDDRTSKLEECVSKSGGKFKAIQVDKDELFEVVNNPAHPHYAALQSAECIGIDEVQFFSRAVEFVTVMMLRHGKSVYMAGLDTDFMNTPWDYFAPMVAICTVAEKLPGVCKMCKSLNGCTSARVGSDTALEVIGGHDKYMTLCLPCFARSSPHKPKHLNIAFV